MTLVPTSVFTPYSTIQPLLAMDDLEQWVPELDRDRIASYQKYDQMYWNVKDTFKLQMTADNQFPVYVPTPMDICDTTAHFFMKGLKITSKNEGLKTAWEAFAEREEFLSKFHIAKQAGVPRGDFLLHITADPSKPAGTRVSVNSIDPAIFFPEWDDDNLDRVTAVRLVEAILDPLESTRTILHVLRYSYVTILGTRRVQVDESHWQTDGWFSGELKKKIRDVKPTKLLPERINTIPVYHFKNKEWQGDFFGSSELRGFERLQSSINQSTSDEELALALEGLGVYATDGGRPTDEAGNEIAWQISPGRVLEQEGGTFFRRVEGINSVKPFQDHIAMMVESMYNASATFRPQLIDSLTAESGIALAIKFLPTMAKLEFRDEAGVSKLDQYLFDWKAWQFVYENASLTGDFDLTLGDKLPVNKDHVLNLANNMHDRKAISTKFYREWMGETFGVQFPEDMEAQIAKEQMVAFENAQRLASLTQPAPGQPGQQGNQSNNKNRPNESGGTEATQTTAEQTKAGK
jgi:hypothetical protein